MKKIALITTNKILAQSLDLAVKARPGLECEFFLLLDSKQALLDAEVLEVDVALIDIRACGCEEQEAGLPFLGKMHKKLPNCNLLLLLSQEDKMSRNIAIQAKREQIIDDFVFYDTSLKYLFAKLASL